MYPEIYNSFKRYHSAQQHKHLREESFRCIHCETHVTSDQVISGVHNRNHCPYCLYSRHLDHEHSGDRMSACKASMAPIGLTVKPGRNKYGEKAGGELMLIHRCSECGKLSINRIAADDRMEMLMEVFYSSASLDRITRKQIGASQIHLLQGVDLDLIVCRLQGCTSI